MRLSIAILLLMLVITQTPFGQLLKLPVLIEHFYKHRKHDQVSLFKFLKDHYTTEHNDADQAEDRQLPFKTVILQNIGFATIPTVVVTDFSMSFDVAKKIIPQDHYVAQQHLCIIFHPPRV
jgi:hypothetical protein